MSNNLKDKIVDDIFPSTIQSLPLPTSILGGNGVDTIVGGAGSQNIDGGNGNDVLDGGAGSDTVSGGNGNDTLIYRATENVGSNDIYDGGKGSDILRLIVSQSLANSSAFQADITALQGRIAQGSASYTFNSIGLTVASVEQLQIVVEPGSNHAPVAVVDTVTGTEDVTLTILGTTLLANDTDADAGDTKTIVSVQDAQHGTVSISNGNITFIPEHNYSGTASFTYTIKDTAGATSTATVTINVGAIADAPTLTVGTAAGNEDSPIALPISGALTDSSETLSFVITGVPAGASLSSGTHNPDGSYTLTSADLSNLKLTPPANFSGDIPLTVTATSTESNGATASTSNTLHVIVAPVADAPLLSVSSPGGNEDMPISLNISGALTDSSETLSFVITGVPVGASLSAGTDHHDGSYTLTSADLSNLKLTPPANFSGDIPLTVTATSTESNGATASTSNTLHVIVAPVADAPLLSVSSPGGNEDMPISLNISGALTDSSETLSFVITGVPADASLSAGTQNPNGSYTLTAAQLSGLTLTPPANFSGDIPLTVTAVSTESDGATATTSKPLIVTVAPLADAPTLTVHDSSGNEDSAIALSISGALADNSETLSFVITGVPVGASLSAGTDHHDGSYTLTSADLSNLKLTPPANFSGDIALSVTAVSTESDGSSTSSTSTLTVTAAPVAEGPDIHTAAATGSTIAPIPLSIDISLIDPNETLGNVVEISGVPSNYILNHGTPNEDGTWFVPRSELSDLTITAQAGASTGPFELQITAFSSEAASTMAHTATLSVTVEQGEPHQSGLVIDGYIAGATVFADSNDNGVLDSGEAWTTTAADGSFILMGGTGHLVMTGGTDVSTGLAFSGTMTALAGSTVITPLTTLVAELVANGQPPESAQSAVLTAFGLSPTIDLHTFDPVPLAGTDPVAAAVLSAAIQVQSTVAQISAVTGNGGDVFAAIADQISASATGTVNLSDTATIAATIAASASVPLDQATIDAVTNVVSAAVSSIQDAGTNVTTIVQAAVVAQGAATEALATTDFSNPAEITSLTDTFVDNLATQVAVAVVGDLDGALVGTIGADVLSGTPSGANTVDAIDGLDGDDTISGFDGNDLLYGGSGRDRIAGGSGDDLIDGGLGFDRAAYDTSSAGINVQLAAGTVTGEGTDTLRGIEGIVGSNQSDTYNAAGFTAISTNGGGQGIYVAGGNGPQGSFNEFQGLDGDDTITGNGNTRISYTSASDAVTVDLQTGTAHGTALGDTANVGVDTILGGVTAIRGSNFSDTLKGTFNSNSFTENFEGWGGNDTIDGNGGFDRARYDNQNTGGLGIAVDLGQGLVTGRDAAATAVVGTDTLRSIESIRGTNAADIFNATGFSATSTNGGGDQGNFNEFEGMGGNDQIFGNGNTRISYVNATGGVSVNITSFNNNTGPGLFGGAGTASGDGSVGTDTFAGITAVRGSSFNDTITGSNNGNTTTESFEGWGGDDTIDGGLGFDRARYDNNNTGSGGIPLGQGVDIQMATGIVTGRDAYATEQYGVDTLRHIEAVRGSNADDIYNAAGYTSSTFGGTKSANTSDSGGTLNGFNEFEGMGGNDTITGNGNTRLSYANAGNGVSVDLTTGLVDGGFSAGHDVIISGVNAVRGSAFADTIIGNGSNNTLEGQGGDDILDGGAGNDSLSGGSGFNVYIGGAGNDTLVGGTALTGTDGNRADYSSATGPITLTLGTATNTSTVSGNASVGTDTLQNIDGVIGTSGNDVVIVANPNASLNQFGTFLEFEGGGGNDTITGNGNLRISYRTADAGVTVDLATGIGRSIIADDAHVGVDTFSGVNAVRGSAFGDILHGSNNALGTVEVFRGLAGNDTIDGLGGEDRLDYGNSDNGVIVTLGANGDGTAQDGFGTQDNFTGIEQIRGSQHDDILTGNGGNNFFQGEAGNDLINGNGGIDIADYGGNRAGGIVATLGIGGVIGNGSVQDGYGTTDTLTGIENIQGSNFDDTITGDDGNNTLRGQAGDDVLIGGGGADFLDGGTGNNLYVGGAGNDTMNGGNAITGTEGNRVDYSSATGPITLTLGTAQNTSTVSGDASVGFDTLQNIDSVVGTSGDDVVNVFNASTSLNQFGTFLEFEGGRGDDTITGNGSTRLSYRTADAGVSVDFGTGIAQSIAAGDAAHVGVDHFTGVNAVRGSGFDDVFIGTNNLSGVEVFRGLAGNDTIFGGGGQDRLDYGNSTNGVIVTLDEFGNGVADDGFGTQDTFFGIEQIRGSQNADILTGNSSNNSFQGDAGNDQINGNGGFDTVDYGNSRAAGIVATLGIGGVIGNGTVQDGYGTTDTLTSIESILGSNFGDAITGDNGNNLLRGQGGNDTIDGGSGNDTLSGGSGADNIAGGSGTDVAEYSGPRSSYTITEGPIGQFQVIDNRPGSPEGTDTVSGVELLRFSDGYVVATPAVDISGLNLQSQATFISANTETNDTLTIGNGQSQATINLQGGFDTLNIAAAGNYSLTLTSVEQINATSGNDHITLMADPFSSSLITTNVNLGDGTDTLTLSVFGVPTINLGLSGVEHVDSVGGIETLNMLNQLSGETIDLGFGFDTINLAAGGNTATLSNIETITAAGTGDDNISVQLDPTLTNQTIDLGGGINTLTLLGANPTFHISVSGTNLTVIGATSVGDEHIDLLNQQLGTTFDLGAGNDSLQLYTPAFGTNVVSVKNVETVLGSIGTPDEIHILNDTGTTTVTAGFGSDHMYASNGNDLFRFVSTQDSDHTAAGRDVIENFNADLDQLVFDDGASAALATAISFIGSGDSTTAPVFSGSGTAEARLVDQGGGISVVEIDANGDGTIGNGDMSIELRNFLGTFDNTDFVKVP